jgi:RND family efflux transporter MFP subunit
MNPRAKAQAAVAAACLGLSFLALACQKKAAAEEPAQAAPVAVKVIKAKAETLTPEISTFGSLSFVNKADVAAAVEGRIAELRVDEGKAVRKGQVLAVLENVQLSIRERQSLSAMAQAKAALEQAEARHRDGKLQVEARLLSLEKAALQLEQKRRELERTAKTMADKKELFAVGGVTQESIESMELSYQSMGVDIEVAEKEIDIQRIGLRDEDLLAAGMQVPTDPQKRRAALADLGTRSLLAEVHVARAQVENASNELESARDLIAELTLVSPMDGTVGARYLERGEKAQADAKVFTVFGSKEVDVVFHVPEATGILLSEGKAVEVSIDTLGLQPFKAAIRQISPMVDPQTGNITVKALMSGQDKRFRPGMFARVRLVYGKPATAILLPSSAMLKKQGERATLFLVVNGRAFQRDVTLGEQIKDRAVVTEGLKEGELVIDSPSPLLREGEAVDAQR